VLLRRPHLLTTVLLLVLWSLAVAVSRASSMDVVLVVDTSGSMAWDVEGRKKSDAKFQGPPRIDRVVAALQDYAKKLPDGTRLRLISFNSGIKTNKEFRISGSTRSDLIASIGALKGEVGTGDTWLPEAVDEGLKVAEAYAAEDPDLTVTLYVLSDGELDYGDPKKNSQHQNFLREALDKSGKVGTDSLYASFVMLGKLKSQGGAFDDAYFDDLKRQAGADCDIALDEDFDPLFPAILDAPGNALPGAVTKIYEVSGGQFSDIEWTLDGQPQPSKQRNLNFTPPKPGRYIVGFKGFDKKGRRARARIALNIGQTPVKAIPRISIDGKPFESVDTIIQGQRMDLSHDSLGPVAKVTWSLNGTNTVADTLKSDLTNIGPYKISLTVESAPDPTGQVTTNTSQPIVFNVVPPRLMAQPEVSVNGKSLAEAGAIHPGAMLTLVSMNTDFAESFEWQIGGEKLSGQTVTWQVPAAGTYNIVHTVSREGASNTAAPISLTVVNPELAAVAEVMYEGKPLANTDNVYTGRTLLLVSKSTGPVKRTVWTINGKEVQGDTVSHEIADAGEMEIKLTVHGETSEQIASSGITKVLAKNPPPVWMLWALGSALTAIWGFLWRLLTRNGPRGCRLESRLHPEDKSPFARADIGDYWSRLTKEARLPMATAVIGSGRAKPRGDRAIIYEFWSKEGEKWPNRYFSIKNARKGSGEPATMAPAWKGDIGPVPLKEDPRSDKNRPRFIFAYPKAPEEARRIYFEISEQTRPKSDFLLLVASTVVIAALFFYFLVKIYPSLS
jgi:hypothetical protein